MSPNYPEISTAHVTDAHLDAIIAIDAKVGGVERPDYFFTKLSRAAAENQIPTSLVALIGPKVVGFLMGETLIGEFGIEGGAATVTVDTIGVDPEYRRRGVATTLLTDYLTNARGLGVQRVVTYVDWNDWDLLQFFHAGEFVPAKTIALEREL